MGRFCAAQCCFQTNCELSASRLNTDKCLSFDVCSFTALVAPQREVNSIAFQRQGSITGLIGRLASTIQPSSPFLSNQSGQEGSASKNSQTAGVVANLVVSRKADPAPAGATGNATANAVVLASNHEENMPVQAPKKVVCLDPAGEQEQFKEPKPDTNGPSTGLSSRMSAGARNLGRLGSWAVSTKP